MSIPRPSTTTKGFSLALSNIIPLHLVSGSASPYGYFMAKALLERGSDPNARDNSGLTPVHVAASWGNYETLKLLLSNGGDPWLEDDDGKTPLDLARQENRRECINLISWWMKSVLNGGGGESADRFGGYGSTPTSTPSPTSYYHPKYFTSPLSGGGGGSPNPEKVPNQNRRSVAPRRALRYDENHPAAVIDAADVVDDDIPGKSSDDDARFLSCVNLEDQKNVVDDDAENRSTKEISSRSARSAADPKNNSGGEGGSTNAFSLLNDAVAEFYNETSSAEAASVIKQLSVDEKKAALAALESTIIEENEEIDPKRLAECDALSDAELRRRAIENGMHVGPITAGTRFLYVRRLACLLSASNNDNKIIGGGGTPNSSKHSYSPELGAALEGRLNEAVCREDEHQLRLSFDQNPSNGLGRKWREGCLKMSFCYLLLDPSITKNLPDRAAGLSEVERFKIFLDAIFYVGKGKKTRPLQHLVQAACWKPDPSSMKNDARLEKIAGLWERGYGVISLHVFQSIIPAEAYSREAAMIDAIGLDRLCNGKRGDYYGASANWALGRRRRFGAFLLKSAASIFLIEGEKQLKREDVLKPSSG